MRFRPSRVSGRSCGGWDCRKEIESPGCHAPPNVDWTDMNVWVRKIHIYLGLLNFSLLIVFGLAGLVVTAEAPDIFRQKQGPTVETRDFTAPPDASDRAVAERIGFAMAPPHAGPPVVRRNGKSQLVAEFYSVNGMTRVTLLESEHRAQVETFRNSIWRFFDNAHATTIGEESNSAVVHAWAWSIEVSIWSLAAMALSGLWLGVTARWKWAWTRVSLAAGCAAFVALYWLER